MPMLRLIRAATPDDELDRRILDRGRITVGRDPRADWFIPDPDQQISRVHCVLVFENGRLCVQDVSANGVSLGASDVRIPKGQIVDVAGHQSLRLGPYVIEIVEERAATERAPPAHASEDAGTLFEAFCEGAGLDPSPFAHEDPAELMRRVGAVYRQMVVGVSGLMNERVAAKNAYGMDRTTINASGNNPFKWAPARVAVDLLRARDDGFLSGPSALESSFEDVQKHLACMLAASRDALGGVLDAFAPGGFEAGLDGQSFILKNRAEACWREFVRAHGAWTQPHAGPESLADKLFREAYERHQASLDATAA